MPTYSETLTQDLQALDGDLVGPLTLSSILSQAIHAHAEYDQASLKLVLFQSFSITRSGTFGVGWTANVSATDTVRGHEGWLANKVATTALSQNLSIAQIFSAVPLWRRQLSDGVKVGQNLSLFATYHLSRVDSVRITQSLGPTRAVTTHETIDLSQTIIPATTLALLQRLTLSSAFTPQTEYHLGLSSIVLFGDSPANYFAAVLSQAMQASGVPVAVFMAKPVLVQNIDIGDSLRNALGVQMLADITIGPMHIPHMIYAGDPLLDGIDIAGFYFNISGITAWAINTRTYAVSEYTNYEFTSFTQIGDRYIAAGPSGVYELDGDDDAGTPIIATIGSGLARIGGPKLIGLKGVYIAIRGAGRYYVKLISGDGREYIYEVVGQPGLMTTKLRTGKGLRTTYLAFELQNQGQDFDLDQVEFIPMVSGRRV